MQVFPTPTGYFVRLDKGEDLLGSLSRFFKDRKVPSAALSGIGAIEGATLGYYDLGRREYYRHEYPGDMELVSLTGNLAWAGDEPVIHAHAVIAGADGAARGGHLFGGRIAATGELVISTFPERRQRSLDPTVGLKLISDQ